MSAAARPTRGPRRPLVQPEEQVQAWVQEARERGQRVAAAQAVVGEEARGRQDVLARLYDAGMSFREIAANLDLSPAVVSGAVDAARRRAAAAGDG